MVARKYETVEGSLRYFRIPPAETVPDLEPVSPRAWKVDDLTCTGGFLLHLLFLSHYPSSISSLPVYIGGRLSSSSPLSGTIRSTITSQPRARPDRTELGREGEEREREGTLYVTIAKEWADMDSTAITEFWHIVNVV